MTAMSSPFIRLATVADAVAIFSVSTRAQRNFTRSVRPRSIAATVEVAHSAWVSEVQEEIVSFTLMNFEIIRSFTEFVLTEYENKATERRLIRVDRAALLSQHSVVCLETKEAAAETFAEGSTPRTRRPKSAVQRGSANSSRLNGLIRSKATYHHNASKRPPR